MQDQRNFSMCNEGYSSNKACLSTGRYEPGFLPVTFQKVPSTSKYTYYRSSSTGARLADPYQQEVTETARLLIKSNVYLNSLVSLTIGTDATAASYPVSAFGEKNSSYFRGLSGATADVNTVTTMQFGHPLLAVQASNFSGFDAAATLAQLRASKLANSLQGQVLASGGFMRVFDIAKVTTSSNTAIINAFYEQVVKTTEFIQQNCVDDGTTDVISKQVSSQTTVMAVATSSDDAVVTSSTAAVTSSAVATSSEDAAVTSSTAAVTSSNVLTTTSASDLAASTTTVRVALASTSVAGLATTSSLVLGGASTTAQTIAVVSSVAATISSSVVGRTSPQTTSVVPVGVTTTSAALAPTSSLVVDGASTTLVATTNVPSVTSAALTTSALATPVTSSVAANVDGSVIAQETTTAVTVLATPTVAAISTASVIIAVDTTIANEETPSAAAVSTSASSTLDVVVATTSVMGVQQSQPTLIPSDQSVTSEDFSSGTLAPEDNSIGNMPEQFVSFLVPNTNSDSDVPLDGGSDKNTDQKPSENKTPSSGLDNSMLLILIAVAVVATVVAGVVAALILQKRRRSAAAFQTTIGGGNMGALANPLYKGSVKYSENPLFEDPKMPNKMALDSTMMSYHQHGEMTTTSGPLMTATATALISQRSTVQNGTATASTMQRVSSTETSLTPSTDRLVRNLAEKTAAGYSVSSIHGSGPHISSGRPLSAERLSTSESDILAAIRLSRGGGGYDGSQL